MKTHPNPPPNVPSNVPPNAPPNPPPNISVDLSADLGRDDNMAANIRRHMLWAFFLIAVLFGGVGGWAAMMKIAGAIIATGTVVVESNSKKVQHQEGGIVRIIHVSNGDSVEAGDLLVQLDTTVTRANLAVITGQLDELHAQKARLIAEQHARADIDFPDRAVDAAHAREIAVIENNQTDLMIARRNAFEGHKKQLGEQIVQFRKQIEGLVAQRDAKSQEMILIKDELKGLQSLLEKGLVTLTRVISLNRDNARLRGEHGNLIAQIAQVREAIGERKIQILQVEEDFQAEILEQLQDVRTRIAQLEEQRIAAEDRSTRVDIRASRSGYIHQLSTHTIGGVIGAGETIMRIVPHEDRLVIEARIQPMDIDQLSPGQEAVVRFPSFDQRTTPELKANLKKLSADLTQDEITGLSYYLAHLTVPESELSKLGKKTLIPGMPAEVFVRTEYRSVLSYLVKPIGDQIAHALRER